MKNAKSILVLTLGLALAAPCLADQSKIKDDVSDKDVVKVAVGSKDHKSLVDLVVHVQYDNVLSNPGPFTVFAPTDAAFAALPAGTAETLKKEANRAKLEDILEYHVFVGTLTKDHLKNGEVFNQANGQNVKITVSGGKIQVNGANILGTVKATNGVVHVIDKVLLPPEKSEGKSDAKK